MDLLKKLFQETLKMRILQRKYHSRNKDYRALNELKNQELEVDLLLNKILQKSSTQKKYGFN